MSVLTSAFVSVKTIHAIGDSVFRKLGSCTSNVMVVDVHHAEFRLKLHGLREQGNKLVQGLLSIWHLRVIDENDSMSILLNWSPTLFVLEITGSIPQFYMDLAKICNTWRRIAFKVNNSTLSFKHRFIV